MTMVAEMSAQELRALIEESVERKLMELLGDPDEGLVLRDEIRTRLLTQKTAVEAGERGQPLQDVLTRLNLE